MLDALWGVPGDLPTPLSSALLAGRELMAAAVAALEDSFARGWPLTEPPRQVMRPPGGQLLLMPSWSQSSLGVKVTTVQQASATADMPRIQGAFVLFELPSMRPCFSVDAGALTAVRTPAVSAVATKLLAAKAARRLLVFGTGPQAAAHAVAMSCVRQLDWIGVVGRDQPRTAQLVTALSATGLPAHVATPDAAGSSDIICTCTNSRVPVFDGGSLPPQVHINAIGTHEPDARELDDQAFAGADVVIEDRSVALREAGDVVLALASGAIPGTSSLHQLRDLAAGMETVAGNGKTIFKSVGSAGQDLVVAEMLMGRFTPQPRHDVTHGQRRQSPAAGQGGPERSGKEER